MIVRNRRRRDTLLGRITRSFSRIKPPAGHRRVLSTNNFQLEVDKEIHRANRRTIDPEFAIVSLDFCDHEVPDEKLDQLIDLFEERLRVSDSIGWSNMELAILLPETGLEGAELVRDSIVEIADSHDVQIVTSISIYPWDDRLMGGSTQRSNSLEKGSNGSESTWSDPEQNGDFLSYSPRFSNDSGGGVAMLAQPKVESTATGKRVFGTGSQLLFSRSEKTPAWKRSIDVVGSGIGLLLLSPVFAAVAVAIKATSKGPVFFRQEREGKDGEVFHILKFRTMCEDAEAKKDDLRKLSEQDGPAFKLENDPRITNVGKYLRKSCIDELPQLLNVLSGNMSIVGPRPLPVNESHQCLPWQRQRLSVLPGLTCTWQARGGRNIKFAEWMRMDLDYIQNRGFWYDMKLIGETALVVVLHKGSV
jgi:lipopolysaccharide/colanic/teichoic acid biosynthesis glycosyltransferase